MPEPGNPRSDSDTVYLCTADESGHDGELIQSTYRSFGSYVVIPGTGIVLQNRGSGFSLDQVIPTVWHRKSDRFIPSFLGFLTQVGRPLDHSASWVGICSLRGTSRWS